MRNHIMVAFFCERERKWKTYHVQNIFKWYEQFNNIDIKISGETKEFELSINRRSLPHLSGLQYINPIGTKKINGRELYTYVQKNNLSDEEIFGLVFRRNGVTKINDVANRINTFKSFMENLENAYIYENTNTYTKIKSNYLIVQTKDNNFLHLGRRFLTQQFISYVSR